MIGYIPPLADYRFLLDSVLDFGSEMSDLGRDLDTDLALAVLEEAGRLCADRLHPLNRPGDEHGCRLVDGNVKTPPGFAEAYREFAAAGWPALSGDPAYGGQGLPLVIQLWVDEMMSATNMSFGLCPSLTRGASEAVAAHASADLKDRWLAPLVSGEWTGAMALTEAASGSDLSLLTTRAEPRGDGSYAVTGSKMFISSGDHDYGGNIVHLVLARLQGAPAGVKGISLFLVPKFLPNETDEYIIRNAMSVGTIEKKMGMHAQPTCLMHYDGATGWLIGQPHQGLAAMFTMMNTERLMCGVQGLGIAGGAYQQALAYAQDRKQGRGVDGTQGPVAIVEHADVRRMLLDIRSFVEGGRALVGWCALQADRARHHRDPSERDRADSLVALLTPVIKASLTDMGFDAAVKAQQVLGGQGYIREWGMEQYVRDARVAQIYEGTNGIQAMDLVSRKIALGDGSVINSFFELVAADARMSQGVYVADRTLNALDLLMQATEALKGQSAERQGAVAADYLHLFALVALGWMWTRISTAAIQHPDQQVKTEVADFFARRSLSRALGLADGILASIDGPPLVRSEAF